MVGPTNLKPRPASSLEICRDSGVSAGTCLVLRKLFLRLAVDEIPQELREARTLLHRVEIGACGEDRAFDLHAVAHDAGVLHQPLDLLRRIARDFLGLEAVEGAAEVVALAQDGDPGEAGLKAIEDQLLIERAVVVFRHAPFLVVIGDVERILLGPGAALEAVDVEKGRVHPVDLAYSAAPVHTLIPPAYSAASFRCLGLAGKRKAGPGRLDQPHLDAAR